MFVMKQKQKTYNMLQSKSKKEILREILNRCSLKVEEELAIRLIKLNELLSTLISIIIDDRIFDEG